MVTCDQLGCEIKVGGDMGEAGVGDGSRGGDPYIFCVPLAPYFLSSVFVVGLQRGFSKGKDV